MTKVRTLSAFSTGLAVSALRRRFGELLFCFKGDDYADLMAKLHALL